MLKKLIILFILTSCYLLLNSYVCAQEVSLSLSPPLLETMMKPGKSILIAYNLQNLGDPTVMKAKILPFTAQDKFGHIAIKKEFEGPVQFSLDNSNLKLDQTFFLKTKQMQQILLRITVPENSPEGDFYYTLLAESQPPPAPDGTSSSVARATIGANILITITTSGQVEIKSKIVQFDVEPRFSFNLFGKPWNVFDSGDKIPINLVIENSGKNVFKPQGQIILQGNFGEKAGYQILPQNVITESKRIMIATPSAQINKSRKTNSLVISGFFIGRYLLTTTVNFGEGTSQLYAATSFIALPFKFGFGLIITILLGIFIVKRMKEE